MIAVARRSEAPVRQVAEDFGISERCLQRRLRIAGRDDDLGGRERAASGGGSAELREARKRIRLTVQENEILRRAAPCLSSLPSDLSAAA